MAYEIWEYQVLEVPASRSEARALLADQGAAGWELVTVVPQAADDYRLTAFLKRPRLEQDADEPLSAGESAPETAPEPRFNIILTGVSAETAEVVIAVARLCPWLHLRDAKRLVAAPPGILATIPSLEEAELLATQLLGIGAIVEVVGL